MPRIDSVSCEPFRAWNRLEPRSRKQDFDDVLKCAVHDPLWMLTRQWQFGEFQGEDTGSAIFAKIKMQTTQITRYKSVNEPQEGYSDIIPTETKVESELPQQDYHCRVKSASYFMKLLKNKFAGASVINSFNYDNYIKQLKTLYPIVFPEPVNSTDAHAETVRKLRLLVNNPLNSFLAANGSQWFDGVLLYTAYKSAVSSLNDISLFDDHKEAVQQALDLYVTWFEKAFRPSHNSSGKGAWINEQLEYQFGVSFPEKEKPNTVLKAEEYYSGDMEWYSFDVAADEQIDGLTGNAKPEELPVISEEILTVIPTLAKYGGMPNPRWWQFEDANIDLGNIDADTTDLSKLIVSEYALIYGNDWLVVPYSLPVGTLTSIQPIVITDVFGERSLIKPALQGDTDDWTAWGLFNLSVRHAENSKNIPADTRLFLPPCVVKTQESEPVEEIHFIKDEMANMVWAIEAKMNSLAGINMEGDTVANYLRNAIEIIEPPTGAIPIDETAIFKYTLENTVPENWIPFVPVHITGDRRAIKLQRASMPRWFKNEYAPVRPITTILRNGVNQNDQVTAAMFVNEEEVPRAGARVTSSFQRTRWYNGKTINWLGKRKNLGRGEGSSGLQFDFLEAVKKEKK